jgi:hypothetical protein
MAAEAQILAGRANPERFPASARLGADGLRDSSVPSFHDAICGALLAEAGGVIMQNKANSERPK